MFWQVNDHASLIWLCAPISCSCTILWKSSSTSSRSTSCCALPGRFVFFPLVQLDGKRSPFVDEVLADVGRAGYAAAVIRVPYEFQRGANQMLRVSNKEPPGEKKT